MCIEAHTGLDGSTYGNRVKKAALSSCFGNYHGLLINVYHNCTPNYELEGWRAEQREDKSFTYYAVLKTLRVIKARESLQLTLDAILYATVKTVMDEESGRFILRADLLRLNRIKVKIVVVVYISLC